MAERKWHISGQYMESCNCDYLCPCIYTNPQDQATLDNCTAALVFCIDKVRNGGVSLDGPCFALLTRSGRVMADNNWVFLCVVDGRADAAQRASLSAVVSGEAGGTPGMIRSALVGDFRGLAFKPIDFRMDGLERSVSISDGLSFTIEGVASRNPGGEPYYTDNLSHPADRRLALARAQRLTVQGFGLELDVMGKGNNGHFAPFAWAA